MPPAPESLGAFFFETRHLIQENRRVHERLAYKVHEADGLLPKYPNRWIGARREIESLRQVIDIQPKLARTRRAPELRVGYTSIGPECVVYRRSGVMYLTMNPKTGVYFDVDRHLDILSLQFSGMDIVEVASMLRELALEWPCPDLLTAARKLELDNYAVIRQDPRAPAFLLPFKKAPEQISFPRDAIRLDFWREYPQDIEGFKRVVEEGIFLRALGSDRIVSGDRGKEPTATQWLPTPPVGYEWSPERAPYSEPYVWNYRLKPTH